MVLVFASNWMFRTKYALRQLVRFHEKRLSLEQSGARHRAARESLGEDLGGAETSEVVVFKRPPRRVVLLARVLLELGQ